MMAPRRYLVLIVLLFLAASGHAQKKQPLIRVLIVDGFSNHNWQQTSLLTKAILEESGLFRVAVSTIPADSSLREGWLPHFADYQVVIQNTNNIQKPALRWPERAERALESYVSAGGGLYILHSANNAFPHWKAYDNMIGLGWRAKDAGTALQVDTAAGQLVRIAPGAGENTSHGKRFDAVIRRFTAHPINSGFPAAWKTPSMELYKYARGPAENLTVLSYATDSATHISWPVDWVVQYGKGRIYNSSMGHLWKDESYPPAYRCIGFQTLMIRAAQWLAGGKVTYGVPAGFPDKHKG